MKMLRTTWPRPCEWRGVSVGRMGWGHGAEVPSTHLARGLDLRLREVRRLPDHELGRGSLVARPHAGGVAGLVEEHLVHARVEHEGAALDRAEAGARAPRSV